MRSLIGLKNIVIFSAVLLAIGSVSAQQAFAGTPCQSNGNGDWSIAANWIGCNGPTPDNSDSVTIDNNDIVITGDEQAGFLDVNEGGTLFIDCDASLLVEEGGNAFGPITNHGNFTADPSVFNLFNTFSNSGTVAGLAVFVTEGGSIVQISTKCSQPIGGTVGSMSTTSLLVAGAQANMGLWSLALVGMVAAGAAITYKLKSKKTNE